MGRPLDARAHIHLLSGGNKPTAVKGLQQSRPLKQRESGFNFLGVFCIDSESEGFFFSVPQLRVLDAVCAKGHYILRIAHIFSPLQKRGIGQGRQKKGAGR